jgi:hypothetical protein
LRWAVRSCSSVETRAYPISSPDMSASVPYAGPSPGTYPGGPYGTPGQLRTLEPSCAEAVSR